MNQETLDKMRQMRLLGMYNAFKISMESFKTESMTTDQFVAWLVSNEWDDRCNRMIERLTSKLLFVTRHPWKKWIIPWNEGSSATC